MKRIRIPALLLIGLLLGLCACEHANFDEYPTSEEGTEITFNISQLEQIPFERANALAARAGKEVASVCTRINLAIFSGTEKVASADQEVGNSDFGTLKLRLPEGSYKVVIIAHSGTGKATISTPDKITFPNNKVSDTFYNLTDITVGSNAANVDIGLKRAVAKFLLKISDTAIPEEVKQFKFYYTGGSSTFNATSGYGDVSSRQTEYREIPTKSASGYYEFEVYTFPHADGKALTMKVYAIDSAENIVKEKGFTNVPVTKNVITQYTGLFFDSTAATQEANIKLTVDDTWDPENYNMTF